MRKSALDVFTHPKAYFKIWKSPYLKKKSGVRVVIDYADTRFSNFATVFACSYGAWVKSIKPPKMVENLLTLSL